MIDRLSIAVHAFVSRVFMSFWLMRHCFLGRWICRPVSERFRLVWKCHLFDYSTFIQFCVHWHGGQCLRRLVPNYAVRQPVIEKENFKFKPLFLKTTSGVWTIHLYTRELKKLWNTKATVIPIIAGTLGTVPKNMEKRLWEQEIWRIIQRKPKNYWAWGEYWEEFWITDKTCCHLNSSGGLQLVMVWKPQRE